MSVLWGLSSDWSAGQIGMSSGCRKGKANSCFWGGVSPVGSTSHGAQQTGRQLSPAGICDAAGEQVIHGAAMLQSTFGPTLMAS